MKKIKNIQIIYVIACFLPFKHRVVVGRVSVYVLLCHWCQGCTRWCWKNFTEYLKHPKRQLLNLRILGGAGKKYDPLGKELLWELDLCTSVYVFNNKVWAENAKKKKKRSILWIKLYNYIYLPPEPAFYYRTFISSIEISSIDTFVSKN